MFISLAKLHMQYICQETKNQGQNGRNKKREDSTEADGLRDTSLNPISILPTTKCLIALETLSRCFNVAQLFLIHCSSWFCCISCDKNQAVLKTQCYMLGGQSSCLIYHLNGETKGNHDNSCSVFGLHMLKFNCSLWQ